MNTSNIVSIVTNNGEFSIDNSLTKDATPIYVSGRRTAWKEQLLKALSRYCGCAFTTEKDVAEKTINYHLVGRRYNIAAMRGLWNWLTARVQDSAKDDAVGNGRIVVNSYCLGFVAGLERTIDLSPYIANTMQREKEAKHYMRLTHYTLHTVPSCNNSNIDQVAFDNGKRKGSSIDLFKLLNISAAA